MGCDLYKVTTGSVEVARYMSLDTAVLLVKALMMEYYNDPEIEYVIKREKNDICKKGETDGTHCIGDICGL